MSLASGKSLSEIVDDTTRTLDEVVRPTWIGLYPDLRARVAEIIAELEVLARKSSERDGGERYATSGGIRVSFDPDADGFVEVHVLMGTLYDSPEWDDAPQASG